MMRNFRLNAQDFLYLLAAVTFDLDNMNAQF